MRTYPSVGEAYGGYVIRRLIGEGGMGAVFEAEQTALRRSVALKVLSPELSDDASFRHRFGHEAAVLAGLDSPHIVSLFDFGAHERSLYIAMHLIDGRDLSQRLRDEGGLSMDSALDIAAQVADALVDAHARGLVHRDVKPSNVLVRDLRGEPFAYLCDFGIATSETSTHTRTTGLMGSVGYMAPERHRGQDADARTDIYSLGCLLWACVSGRPPFEGASDVQVAIAHLQQPVPLLTPSTWATEHVDTIVAKAMAKDPADRFQTAQEMRSALLQARTRLQQQADLRSEPSSSRAVQDLTVARRPAPLAAVQGDAATSRSGRKLVALLTVLTTLVVAGAVVVGVGLGRGRAGGPSVTVASGPHGSVTSPSTSPRHQASAGDHPDPVTCWDGARAARAARCSEPAGAAGLAWVFPRFDPATCERRPTRVEGKTLVYECGHDPDLVIRYSEWQPHTGRLRFEYLDGANPGATTAAWAAGGHVSGTSWTSYESRQDDPEEAQRFQWSATYAHHPFEVSVEGRTRADRARGIAGVLARPSEKLTHR